MIHCEHILSNNKKLKQNIFIIQDKYIVLNKYVYGSATVRYHKSHCRYTTYAR